MKRYTFALLLCAAISVRIAAAEIVWLPESSNYNGTTFASLPMPGLGVTTTGAPAYGATMAAATGAVFGFINQITAGPPTMTQTDLSSTVLIAGTSLVLEFSKAETDRINFVAMLSDAEQPLNIQMLSSTRFRILGTVVDPVQSAGGNAGAAFGLYIDTQKNDSLNFDSALFVTDLHYLDISAPAADVPGTAGISGNGINGVAAHFTAFLPLSLLTKFGISDPSLCQGYIDGSQVPAGQFENLGVKTGLGFDFDPQSESLDSVLKLRITNDQWSIHTLQFGVKGSSAIDTTAPTLTVTGGLKKTSKSASLKVRGTVTDALSGVARVRYSTTSKTKAFKNAKLTGSGWSFTIANLLKGKAKKVFVKAVDRAGNQSAVTAVQITRVK